MAEATKPAPKSRTAKSKAPATKSKSASGEPVLLSGGNPQIAKGYGDASVQAYIAAMPGWKQDVGRRLDTLITRTVPGVRKAVKWNTPLYGLADAAEASDQQKTWFMSFHCFNRYVKVAFFRGASLIPVPPGPSKHQDVRYLDIPEGDAFDEAQFVGWVQQAVRLPGERL